MENQIIQINLVPNMSTPAVVRVSQYDVGRPLVFKVYDGTIPADLTGVTAVIEGTKRSGLGFSESGTVTDNTVTLNTTIAMTQEYGSIPAEIRFSKTGEDVGTANFILAVEKTPHADGTTDGTADTALTLMQRAEAAVAECEDIAESISTTGLSAVGARAGQVPTADGNGSWEWADQQGGGGSTVVVDSALSATSRNPVQNRVIYAAIGNIETLLSSI